MCSGIKNQNMLLQSKGNFTEFGTEPPTKMAIYKWCKLFNEAGCICEGKCPGK
jgi:hypothetical protein